MVTEVTGVGEIVQEEVQTEATRGFGREPDSVVSWKAGNESVSKGVCS